MAFWDLADNRYREARILLLLSILGLIVGPAVLLWLYWPVITGTASGSAPAVHPTAPTTASATVVSPKFTAFDQTKPLREEMLQAVQAQDLDRAADVARKILELRPEDVDTWDRLAGIYRQKGDFAKAIAAYDRAVDLSMEPNPHFYYRRSLLHRRLRDYPAALRDMKEAARLDAGSATISNHLLILQLEGGEEPQAAATMRSNITMNLETQKPMWLMALAAQFMKEGDFGQARDALVAFKTRSSPEVFAELAADPFFDPYRDNPALQSFLQPAKFRSIPAPAAP